MRKYSLPVRVAAFACALCLLLTGCGQVASPDDSGDTSTPVRESHPAAEAKAAQEKLEAAKQEVLAAQEELEAAQRAAAGARMAQLAVQLATEHLGKDVTLTNVVSFSVDDFEGAPWHVLLLRDIDDHYLAYSYDTKAVYCPASEAVYHGTNDWSTEENRCLYLLWLLAADSIKRVNAYPYLNSGETRTELTPSEVKLVNLALARGEEIPAVSMDELKAAQRAAASARATRLAAEYLGNNTKLTHAVEYSIEDFEGEPCHVLLLKDIKNSYLAYSYDTEAVYSATSNDLLHYTGSRGELKTEEDRCLYLLRQFLDSSDSTYDGPYVSSNETRTELTESELAQVNRILADNDAQPGLDDAALAELEAKASQLAAVAIEAQAAQMAAEHLGQDTTLTNVVEISLDDFDGFSWHALLLRDTDDRYLAYSYDTDTVYCPSSDDLSNFSYTDYADDRSSEGTRCTYLLHILFDRFGGNYNDIAYLDSSELRIELTAAELEQANLALARGETLAVNTDELEAAQEKLQTAQRDAAIAQVEETTAGNETLPASIALPTGSGAYKVLDECPEKFARRELSDEEISALAQGDLETARKRISTGGDFAAWLVALGGQFYSGVTSNDEGQKTIGADFDFEWIHQMVDSAMAAALAVRVLGDDLPGIGIVAARVAENDGTFLCGNLIPAEDGYYIISFDALTDEWKAAVEPETNRIIPEAFLPIRVDGAAGITAWCWSVDNPRGNTLTQAFYIPGDQQVVLDYKDEIYTPRSPWGIQEFFRDDTLAADLAEQKVAHIKPEYIGNYELSTKLGGATLTPEEAYALLDMEPEQVKERVKTAADVLMLMLAGQYGHSGGDRTKTIDGREWHYNLNAFQVMQTRTLNCGSAANLANYLLEGDYEEVGFILQAYYIGGGGGHVYNYFKYQGKYYIVDFSWYMFNDYQPGRDFPVMEADRLKDLGSQLAELYGNVCMILAHTSPGQHYPNVFDDQNAVYAIPEGVEYTLLYQGTAGNAYTLKEYPLDKSQLDWTTFGEP